MNLSSHISELRKKHEALSHKIEESARHPSTDELELTELKRKKLHLKDEIERMSQHA